MITCPWEYLARIPALGQPLTCLKGVGPKRARLLAEKNIHTILDLFYCIPLRYEDRTRLLPIGSAKGSEPVLVCGTVVTAREAFFPRSRKRLFRVVIEDGSGRLTLIWFHYRKQHLAGLALKGTSLLVYGQLQKNGAEKQLIHPEIIPHTPGREKDSLHIHPVYPIIEGISRRTLRSMVLAAFTLYGKDIVDPLPASIREPRGLLNLRSSFQEIHLPPPESSVERLNLLRTQGHRRLRFDVACKVMLNLAFRKAAGKRWTIPPLSADPHLKARLREILPFSLTPGQHAAVRDILRDFTAGHPMSRLIQGDVGCGKTIVAAVAAFIAVSHKKQVAFMVPTQVLAAQHWSFFHDFHAGAGFKPALLTGGLLPSDLKKLRGEIEAGRVNVIIGTHALIQESVTFHDLGLAIIDEQHRFGVRQRALLDRKGNHPHMLVLSATPIPR
ncbi:MAG: DEAD/DEAH box helicase, partial [Deltaproteobacteria bacterium]